MIKLRDRSMALVLALAMSACVVAIAGAQKYDAALQGFTKNSFNDTDDAIAAIGISGHPLAVRLIEALQDGRLVFSAEQRKVFIRESGDILLDASTGQTASAAPGDLRAVRI